jgi:hypothetical protein
MIKIAERHLIDHKAKGILLAHAVGLEVEVWEGKDFKMCTAILRCPQSGDVGRPLWVDCRPSPPVQATSARRP